MHSFSRAGFDFLVGERGILRLRQRAIRPDDDSETAAPYPAIIDAKRQSGAEKPLALPP